MRFESTLLFGSHFPSDKMILGTSRGCFKVRETRLPEHAVDSFGVFPVSFQHHIVNLAKYQTAFFIGQGVLESGDDAALRPLNINLHDVGYRQLT